MTTGLPLGTTVSGAAGIEAAAGEFVRVFVIILADAKDVAPRLRNGRFHRYLIERNRRQRRRQARAVSADQGKNAVLRLGNRQIEWR
jgi:hypothetical protein